MPGQITLRSPIMPPGISALAPARTSKPSLTHTVFHGSFKTEPMPFSLMSPLWRQVWCANAYHGNTSEPRDDRTASAPSASRQRRSSCPRALQSGRRSKTANPDRGSPCRRSKPSVCCSVAIRSSKSAAPIGSSPDVGSSRNRISGSSASARASAARLIMPPDNSDGYLSAASCGRPTMSSLSRGQFVHQLLRQIEIFAHRHLDVLRHGQPGKQCAVLEQHAPAPLTVAARSPGLVEILTEDLDRARHAS